MKQFLWLLPVLLLGQMPAMADSYCVKRDDLHNQLADKFHEELTAQGLAGKAALVEIFTSPDGSLTITATDATGRSCIVAAGDNWQAITPAVKGDRT